MDRALKLLPDAHVIEAAQRVPRHGGVLEALPVHACDAVVSIRVAGRCVGQQQARRVAALCLRLRFRVLGCVDLGDACALIDLWASRGAQAAGVCAWGCGTGGVLPAVHPGPHSAFPLLVTRPLNVAWEGGLERLVHPADGGLALAHPVGLGDNPAFLPRGNEAGGGIAFRRFTCAACAPVVAGVGEGSAEIQGIVHPVLLRSVAARLSRGGSTFTVDGSSRPMAYAFSHLAMKLCGNGRRLEVLTRNVPAVYAHIHGSELRSD